MDNKLIGVLLGVVLIMSLLPAWAQDPLSQKTVQKRFEEENRVSLQPTEAVADAPKPADKIVLPLQSVNKKYLQRLLKQANARKIDAIYLAVVLLNKQKELTNGPAQFAYLKDNGFLPKTETGDNLNAYIQKGELSCLLCKVLKIKGGIHLRLFGVSERYALAELIYEGIMMPGNWKDIVTGKELVFSFVQSTDYKMGLIDDDF